MAKSQARLTKSTLTKRLVMVAVGMFGFGFALVPLYDVLCDIAGINGKPSNTAASYENVEVDKSRLVTVEFITRGSQGIPWEFKPAVRRVQVHPGEINEVMFIAHNQSGGDMTGQAVPSVSPGMAALYLNKTECFCFNKQPVKAGERVEMPMRFYVDPEIPDDITVFTLSYTMYDITEPEQDS